MLAGDTIFFIQIKTLFGTVNCELKNIIQWFRANKLSLNIKKQSIHYFINILSRQNSFKIANIENRKQSNIKNTIHKILRSDVG